MQAIAHRSLFSLNQEPGVSLGLHVGLSSVYGGCIIMYSGETQCSILNFHVFSVTLSLCRFIAQLPPVTDSQQPSIAADSNSRPGDVSSRQKQE